MWNFILSLGEKIIDKLISLRVKPTVVVDDFRIEHESNENKIIHFSVLVSNNGDKTISISKKFLLFFNGKEEIAKIDTTRYEIVRKRDAFDELNILTPIDDIITLPAGETKKIKIIDRIATKKEITEVIFTYYTGRKTYKHILPIPIIENKMNKDNDGNLGKQDAESDINIIKNGIRFINKNIAAFTWISTVLVAIFTAVLKFSQYAFEAGKVHCLKIDPSAIEINSNTIYGILLSIVLGALLLLVTLIPYLIHKSSWKKIFKIFSQIGIFGIFGLVIGFAYNLAEFLDMSNISSFIILFIALSLAYLLFFAPSFIFGITFRKKRKKHVSKEQSLKSAIVFLLLWVVFTFGYTYVMGVFSVVNQSEYHVTSDGYAVVYENKDLYYLSEYKVIDGNIICDHTKQKVIKKQDSIDFIVLSEKNEK
ncbi:MAG: hypothetical protein J1F23_07655 [Oscillospiraceae bacterium]|nr:hypothetical protein [Oscillospiraceae bacterium]